MCGCVRALCTFFRFRRWVNALRKRRETLPDVDFRLHPSQASSSHTLHLCPTSISDKPERLLPGTICTTCIYLGRGWNNDGRLSPLKERIDKSMNEQDRFHIWSKLHSNALAFKTQWKAIFTSSVGGKCCSLCKQTAAKTICWQCLHIMHVEY